MCVLRVDLKHSSCHPCMIRECQTYEQHSVCVQNRLHEAVWGTEVSSVSSSFAFIAVNIRLCPTNQVFKCEILIYAC